LISFSGTALGPLLLGWLYDVAGGYRSSYLAAGACSIIGAVLFSFAGSATVASDKVASAEVTSANSQ
jgi:MFS family permease